MAGGKTPEAPMLGPAQTRASYTPHPLLHRASLYGCRRLSHSFTCIPVYHSISCKRQPMCGDCLGKTRTSPLYLGTMCFLCPNSSHVIVFPFSPFFLAKYGWSCLNFLLDGWGEHCSDSGHHLGVTILKPKTMHQRIQSWTAELPSHVSNIN